MDTVVFDDVTYLKASQAAKEFNYTADYIGQLCRGKKIDARLVGRTWFVNADSIKAHKKNRHKNKATQKSVASVTNKTAAADQASVAKPDRKVVPPVIKSKTLKSSSPNSNQVKKLSVAYEPDEESLLPVLKKRVIRPPRWLRVEPADAKKVHIAGSKTTQVFAAEALPEVSLSGTLTVSDFPPPEPEPEPVTTKPTSTSATKKKKVIVLTKSKKSFKNRLISAKPDRSDELKESALKVHLKKRDVADVVETESAEKTKLVKPESPQAAKKPLTKKTTPSTLTELKSVAKQSPEQVKLPSVIRFSPLLASLLALLFVLVIFSASTQVFVTAAGYQSQVVLQVENLLELLRR